MVVFTIRDCKSARKYGGNLFSDTLQISQREREIIKPIETQAEVAFYAGARVPYRDHTKVGEVLGKPNVRRFLNVRRMAAQLADVCMTVRFCPTGDARMDV